MKVSTFLFKTEHLNNLAPQSTLEFQIPKCEWYLKRLSLVASAKLSQYFDVDRVYIILSAGSQCLFTAGDLKSLI